MHRGHQTFFETEVVEDHLGDGRETVGGAARIRDHRVGSGVVLLVVDLEDQRLDFIWRLGGCGDQHSPGTGGEVLLRVITLGEETGRFQNVVDTQIGPGQIRRITFAGASACARRRTSARPHQR